MKKRFADWLDVRDGEEFVALGAFLCLFGIVAGHTILETARDALFLSKLPASQLTVVYAAVALGTLLVAGWNTRFVERFGQRNALVSTLLVGSFVTTLLHFQHMTRPVLFLLYSWSALIGAVLIAQFWMYAAQLFTVAQGKRLFASVASGAVLGGVFGASGAALVVPHLPVRALLLGTAALFLMTAILLTYMPMPTEVRADETAPEASDEQSDIGFWALVRKVPYLRELALFTLLGTATLLVSDYLFKFIVATRVPAAQLGGFFAKTYAVLNVASLLVQFFLTRRIVRRAGVVPALVVLPLLLACGNASIALVGGALVLAMLTKGADGGLRYSLQRVAGELLWLPLASDVRARAKALIDTVLAKITQAFVAGGLFVLVPLGLSSPRVLASIAFVLSLLWLGTTVVMRGAYLDLFRQALSLGAPDLQLDVTRLDLASLVLVLEALSSREATRVVAAMELLRDHKLSKLIPALILYHESEDVLARALTVVATPDRKDWVPLAGRLLHHPEERVRVEAVRALSRANEHDLVMEAHSDPSLSVRAHAALMSRTPEEVNTAVRELLEVKGAEAQLARVALIDAITDQADPRWNDLVLKLAVEAGDDFELADHAVRAMTQLGDPRFIPWLLPRIGLREGRQAVRDALVQQGERALDALGVALLDPSTDPEVRLHIPRSISRFSSQRAADLLLEVLLSDPRGLVRYKALRGLGRLVTDTALSVDRGRVDPEIRKNLVEALRITALELALGMSESGPTSGRLLSGLLQDKRKQAVERAFRLLQIAHRNEDIRSVYLAIVGGEKARRAQALEFLDALTIVTGHDRRVDASVLATRDDIRELVLLVGDDLPPATRTERAARHIGAVPRSRDEALAQLEQEPDKTMATVSAFYAEELRAPSSRARVEVPPTSPESEALRGMKTWAPSLPRRTPAVRARAQGREDEIARHLFLQQLMGTSPGSVVSRLAHQMTERTFTAGAVLYDALTPSTSIFFIKSGDVEQQNPATGSRSFKAPAVLGGFDAVTGRPHVRRTLAVTEVEALVLDREDWLDALEDQFEFARQFMNILCQQLGRAILAKPADGSFSVPTPAGEATLGLHLVERVLLLRSVTAFEAATIQSLALVAQIATEVEYSAGETIETEGARAKCIFVVASGQAEVTHKEPAVVGRMGPGQLVGGPASLGIGEHLFAVQMIAPTVLLSIPHDGLFDIMEDHFDLTFSALFALGMEIERTFAAPRPREAVSTGPLAVSGSAPPV